MISACLAAWRATGNAEWKADAACAFAWFLGSNDLSLPLVDLEPEAAATACILTVPMKTRVANLSYPTCLGSRRFASLLSGRRRLQHLAHFALRRLNSILISRARHCHKLPS